MFSSMYIGATGIKTHSDGLQTVSNNLANVSTVGYKSQFAIFHNLISQFATADTAIAVGMAQKGQGVAVADVRTNFNLGAFEPGNAVTDMAISGYGFFQVVKNGETAYTRAGNFRFSADGYLRNPNGYTLQGRPITDGVAGALGDIYLDINSDRFMTSPAKATSQISVVANMGVGNAVNDSLNPFFSMTQAWDANGIESPLPSSAYSGAANLPAYDSAGNQRALTIYFDQVDVPNASGYKYYEYIVGMNPAEDARTSLDASGQYLNSGAGLLMSGILVFNSAGQLVNQSAYVPQGGNDFTDLNNLVPAALNADGLPKFTASFNAVGTAAAGTAAITLDLGLHGTPGATPPAGATAAGVGSNPANLPLLSAIKPQKDIFTAYGASYGMASSRQDGYPLGYLLDLSISAQGVMSGRYTNSQSQELYQIPLFNFTDPYGLTRAGKNLYHDNMTSGPGIEGLPTQNGRGSIVASTLETSNVDMAFEMVEMIVMQRGLQSNGKVITTTDQLLNTAIQMKR